jgi:hypothetical protein
MDVDDEVPSPIPPPLFFCLVFRNLFFFQHFLFSKRFNGFPHSLGVFSFFLLNFLFSKNLLVCIFLFAILLVEERLRNTLETKNKFVFLFFF